MRDWPPSLNRGDLPRSPADPGQGLADITAGDAGFDRSMFMDQARATLFAVKQAVEARDLTPVAGRLGTGVMATLQEQAARLAGQHAFNHFDDLSIDEMTISRAAHGPDFDHVVVRFDVRAAQYAVDDAKHQLIFGDRTVRPFIEYWTFSRAAGARTSILGAPPVCPNCGAPIAADSGPSCRYCMAALPARQTFDWIVTEIQDPIDYRP